ncbi:MAG: ATP phosphoribosyltransferase regulatory subunit [Candidatus Tectimicrobiota bacterium]
MLRSELPRGTRVLLPFMAAKKRRLEELLLAVFFRWGFQEVVLPTFEYMDVLTLGLGEAYKERMFKLEERRTGRMLSLRPDITTQIAKLSATLLQDQPRPLRFCYVANIFRHNESQTRNLQELYQTGVELLGLESPEADAEMIAIAVECMQEVGLQDFRLAVSQLDFCRSLMAEAGLNAEEGEQLHAALQKKDTSTLEILVTQFAISERYRQVLLEIPSLFGSTEVLHRAANLSQSQAAQAALENLAQVYDMLKTYGLEDRVLIDLSDIRGFHYYTGITFEGFTSHLGYGVCSGGRYDHLLGCYGVAAPSTGFAIDLEALLEALENSNPIQAQSGADCLLMDFRKDKREALRISRELRGRGHRVARDIITRDLQGSLDYARRMGIRYGLLMGLAPLTDDEAMLYDVTTGAAERLPLARVVDHVDAILTRAQSGVPARRID